MSNFKFKLESVLKLRNQKTEEAKAELQTIMKSRIEKESEIEECKDELKHHFTTRGSKNKLEDIQTFYRYKDYLKNEIERLDEEKENLMDIEDIKRDKYNDALKEEKAISNLKDKKKEEFLEEINSREQKELDEIGIRQYSKDSKKQ